MRVDVPARGVPASNPDHEPGRTPTQGQTRPASSTRGHVLSTSIFVLAIGCFLVPYLTGVDAVDPSLPTQFVIGDLPDDIEHANHGAFEGGPTESSADAAIQTVIAEDDLRSGGGYDIPTGGFASPLYGAQPFTQKLIRFEEFGVEPLPDSYSTAPAHSFPPVANAQSMPDGTALDLFLDQQLWPEPTRKSNVTMENPLKSQIEAFLGHVLEHTPLEGRPPGEGWAHQRYEEFFPMEYFQSAMTGARPNGGLRDARQRHGYAHGEFAPGGLYHSNVAGTTAFDGTNQGLPIKIHPNMPEQDPLSLWTFDGTLPPKLLMSRIGRPVLFRHHNALPIDPSANRGFGLHTISTHEHNGHNPGESDGYANAFFFPGQFYDYRWPMSLAGNDSINANATDPRCACPEDDGTSINVRGDVRETMSTHWFHDHMLDFTAQNVYKGNAAMMNIYSAIDRGNEAINDGVNLRFPSGTALGWGNRDYDVNFVIGDKAWTGDGQLWFNIFNLDGFVGDQLLTNWLYKPYFDVRARKYRFRLLNGSVSRYLKIALVDQNGNRVPFHMIANDGNVMEHAVAFDGTRGTELGVLPTQAIAERYDIIVDFSSFQPGDKLYFVNLMEHKDGRRAEGGIPLEEVLSGEYQAVVDGDRWDDGDPCVGKFLEFRVHAYDGVDTSMNPQDYVSGGLQMIPLNRPTNEELANARHRTFTFGRSSGTDSAPWTVKTDGGDGFTADPRRVAAAPTLNADGMGSLEIWHIENGGGGWAHPVHVHFEEGQILSRGGEPPPEWEKWARKDVYRVGPLEDSTDSVEIAIRFREFAGTYVEHCHNTQHEDHAMLIRWDIENPGQFLVMPTPLPTWEGVNYVESVALPTFRTGDGFGPTELELASGGGGNDGGGNDGDNDDGGNEDDPPAPTVSMAISRAEYDVSKRKWRIEGTSSLDGHSVEAFLGAPEDGKRIGASEVDDGEFDVRRRRGPNPTASGAANYITVVSSLGGATTAAVELD